MAEEMRRGREQKLAVGKERRLQDYETIAAWRLCVRPLRGNPKQNLSREGAKAQSEPSIFASVIIKEINISGEPRIPVINDGLTANNEITHTPAREKAEKILPLGRIRPIANK
jgi:hypothetical protein